MVCTDASAAGVPRSSSIAATKSAHSVPAGTAPVRCTTRRTNDSIRRYAAAASPSAAGEYSIVDW